MKEFNCSVFNALSIISENLANKHLKKGFNPYGRNFDLQGREEYVNELLNNAKKEVEIPSFAFENQKEYKKAVSRSMHITNDLLKETKSSLKMKSDIKTKYFSVYLKIREELLRESKKSVLAFQDAYKSMNTADAEFSACLEESFYENCDYNELVDKLTKEFGVNLPTIVRDKPNLKINKQQEKQLEEIADKNKQEEDLKKEEERKIIANLKRESKHIKSPKMEEQNKQLESEKLNQQSQGEDLIFTLEGDIKKPQQEIKKTSLNQNKDEGRSL